MATVTPPFMPAAKPLDGYIRVSRVGDRSGDSYVSPAIQQKAIRKLAADRGLEVVIREPDENWSGGTMDRPVFNECMARIRRGESGGIIVYTLDRFARNLIGGYTLMTELQAQGALFASATEPAFDFTTSTGRLMLQMHLAMAEYFRERQRESFAASVKQAVEKGIHITGYGAYGYDLVDRRFVRNEDEAPFVEEAFRMRAEDGASFAQIAAWLNEHAPPRRFVRRGEANLRTWAPNSASRMIKRRVYLGEAYSGKETRNPDAHEPLVTEAMFNKAQKADPSWTNGQRRADTPEFLLAGLIRCAACRYAMSPRRVDQEPGRAPAFVYVCRGNRSTGKCGATASVAKHRIEEYVERLVTSELDHRAAEYAGHPDSSRLDAARAKVKRAQTQWDDVCADTTLRKALGGRWGELVAGYAEELNTAQEELARLRDEVESAVHGLTSEAYLAMPLERRRLALADMVDVVFVRKNTTRGRGRHIPPLDDQRVRVLWRGDGPDDLPTRARAEPTGIRPWDGFAEAEAEAGVPAA